MMSRSNARPVTRWSTPYTFSQSSLQDFADCPRRFQLRYLEQLASPAVDTEPSPEFERRQEEGRIFHRLVQQHIMGIAAERLAPFANTPNLRRWWQNYLDAHLDVRGQEQRCELTLACNIGSHRLAARYDLVVASNGAVSIFDWKTSARRPPDEWLAARWQTAVYRIVMATAGVSIGTSQPIEPRQIRMIYWFADYPNRSAEFLYDAQQFRREWSATVNLVDEITSADNFPMTEDRKTCRFCVYRSHCDRGSTAGAQEQLDAEPDLGEVFDLNLEQIGETGF